MLCLAVAVGRVEYPDTGTDGADQRSADLADTTGAWSVGEGDLLYPQLVLCGTHLHLNIPSPGWIAQFEPQECIPMKCAKRAHVAVMMPGMPSDQPCREWLPPDVRTLLRSMI